MANQNPDGKVNYWYEGVSTTLIKSISSTSIGTGNYWYNGSPQGFLEQTTTVIKTRNFAVLINF